jgi:hypothetical protein
MTGYRFYAVWLHDGQDYVRFECQQVSFVHAAAWAIRQHPDWQFVGVVERDGDLTAALESHNMAAQQECLWRIANKVIPEDVLRQRAIILRARRANEAARIQREAAKRSVQQRTRELIEQAERINRKRAETKQRRLEEQRKCNDRRKIKRLAAEQRLNSQRVRRWDDVDAPVSSPTCSLAGADPPWMWTWSHMTPFSDMMPIPGFHTDFRIRHD